MCMSTPPPNYCPYACPPGPPPVNLVPRFEDVYRPAPLPLRRREPISVDEEVLRILRRVRTDDE